MATRIAKQFSLGKSFIHPFIDYGFIGGGLSLVGFFILWKTDLLNIDNSSIMPGVALAAVTSLFFNFPHFAASTVRLYSKKENLQTMPFVTQGLPVLFFVFAVLGIYYSNYFGRFVNELYLTWSPYHYAAQAFGLSMIYCHKAGIRFSAKERRVLYLSCMLPFLWGLTSWIGEGGLAWLINIENTSEAKMVCRDIMSFLKYAIVAVPLGLFFTFNSRRENKIPMIVPLIILSNGIWFVVFGYYRAFIWATIAHSIQYLFIFSIFDGLENKFQDSKLIRVFKIYSVCLLLGYAIFRCLPFAFTFLGHTFTESVFVVVALINIHHFVVDAFIWKKPNRKRSQIPMFHGTVKGASLLSS